jgi:NTE family protein
MKIVLLIAILFISGFVFSQENQQKDDVKVGLVLSGGGAKGMAHIGALKVIEESGVRIDYIGGTSTGAIIGGLYAAGYSPVQIDSIFKDVNFSELIQDDLPRSTKTFFEKYESERYALTLPFNNFKISLPSSISKGQNMYNMFSKLTSHVNDIEDFNELPIPFFCIATNIESGKETLLNKGYLPIAISASSALPTLFNPVKLGDSLYVDGGITNNYPIDRVRAMGADVIIGIDVQDSLKTRENLKTAIEILGQIGNYESIEVMKEKRNKTDIYIHPNINDYTVVSFDEKNEIIESGLKEALLFKNELIALAAQQKKTPKKKVVFHLNDSLFITGVRIQGNKQYTRSYILGKLKLKIPSKTTYKKLSEGVNNLSATENFKKINYRFFKDEKGELIVKFDVIESEDKTSLRLSLHYDDLYKTAVLVNITRKRLFTNNDITSFDFIVGDNLRYNFDYFIDKGYYWSIGFNSNYNDFTKNVFIDFIRLNGVIPNDNEVNSLSFEYGELTNQIFLQTFFKKTYLLGVGVEQKWKEYLSKTIGIDENNELRTVFDNTNYLSAFGYVTFDSFDNKFFPTKGFYLRGDFNFNFYANGTNKNFNEFSIIKTQIGYAQTIFKNFSALLEAAVGVKIGGDETKSFDFFVGGYGYKESSNLVPLYGYKDLSLRGNTYLKATITLDYNIYKKGHINIAANIANVGDDLFDTQQWIDGIDYSGYAFGLGWDTFLGPIEAKYSYSPEIEDSAWYVSIGYRF